MAGTEEVKMFAHLQGNIYMAEVSVRWSIPVGKDRIYLYQLVTENGRVKYVKWFNTKDLRLHHTLGFENKHHLTYFKVQGVKTYIYQMVETPKTFVIETTKEVYYK